MCNALVLQRCHCAESMVSLVGALSDARVSTPGNQLSSRTGAPQPDSTSGSDM